jgi:hypothetical protein
MAATLSRTAPAPLLRAGVQPAIASGEGDSRTAIELELISVLDGPSFRASSRSRDFLRYVVEETLAGHESSLKERTIGVAVLGRNLSYDTGADAAVRVRANDVRKRLAAYYERFQPKAGTRIELPLGTYVPRFVAEAACPAQPAAATAAAPPMPFWQLAAPTVFALFLAVIAIRADVDASDSFSRFWSRVLANRSQLVVEVDPAPDGVSISPAMAEAALSFSNIASSFQVPIHIVAARQLADPRAGVIRLSTTTRPPFPASSWSVAGATLFYASKGNPVLWLFARDSETLTRAVQSLSDRTGFPEIH